MSDVKRKKRIQKRRESSSSQSSTTIIGGSSSSPSVTTDLPPIDFVDLGHADDYAGDVSNEKPLLEFTKRTFFFALAYCVVFMPLLACNTVDFVHIIVSSWWGNLLPTMLLFVGVLVYTIVEQRRRRGGNVRQKTTLWKQLQIVYGVDCVFGLMSDTFINNVLLALFFLGPIFLALMVFVSTRYDDGVVDSQNAKNSALIWSCNLLLPTLLWWSSVACRLTDDALKRNENAAKSLTRRVDRITQVPLPWLIRLLVALLVLGGNLFPLYHQIRFLGLATEFVVGDIFVWVLLFLFNIVCCTTALFLFGHIYRSFEKARRLMHSLLFSRNQTMEELTEWHNRRQFILYYENFEHYYVIRWPLAASLVLMIVPVIVIVRLVVTDGAVATFITNARPGFIGIAFLVVFVALLLLVILAKAASVWTTQQQHVGLLKYEAMINERTEKGGERDISKHLYALAEWIEKYDEPLRLLALPITPTFFRLFFGFLATACLTIVVAAISK